MHKCSKKKYIINNIHNEIKAEVPDYEVADPVNRKRSRFALLVEEET